MIVQSYTTLLNFVLKSFQRVVKELLNFTIKLIYKIVFIFNKKYYLLFNLLDHVLLIAGAIFSLNSL